ncbi:MAG: flippase-like domain-containing protein, partial [Deltaproteobacteria bacterium]|nr:flippase-like domain-containing protein [Deltaproteobacteria bacterium]
MKFFRPILFLIAILLAWTIIRHLGPAKIWGHIRMAGWGMSLVFLMGFPRFLLYTLGWKEFLPSGAYRLRKLYQIKIAGELITRSTPVHFVGGDTARVLLMGKNIPRKNQTGSVIIDRTVMTLGAAVMVLLGLLIASFRLPLPWLPKLALWLLVALL